MVAYSFKRRFVNPIRAGLELKAEPEGAWTTYVPNYIRPKRHTIRTDRARHARPGEVVQLYCGMRTKNCFLIGEGRCTDTQRITIHFRKRRNSDWMRCAFFGKVDRPDALDRFARSDGFQDWAELRQFWRDNHPGVDDFSGIIIFWEPLSWSAP